MIVCNSFAQSSLELVQHRSATYRNESLAWHLDGEQVRMNLPEFEDFLGQGVRLWDLICRKSDELQRHDMDCPEDHADQFEIIAKAIQQFAEQTAHVIQNGVPVFEKQFGVVDYLDQLRDAEQQARAISTPLDADALRASGTPIEQWGE